MALKRSRSVSFSEFCETYKKVSSCNSQSDIETDDEIGDGRGPGRNVRRKSVLSPRMLTLPEPGDFSDSNSAANSVTSVNSLASLLKEKIQTLPQRMRKKKSNDYKIKVFVVFLFITIVALICCAYFLYNQKILAKAYFERVKFNKNKRIMTIHNRDGVELVSARLGTTMNYDKVLPCLPQDERRDGSICLEWMDRARLYLHVYNMQESVKCYNLKWIALNDHISPTDCIEMAPGVHWYGGGQNQESAWPLEKGAHDFRPFITGNVERHEWGNVLKRYFISSKGVAIIVDEKTPLYVSITDDPKKAICLRAKYDNFAFVNRFTLGPELNYSVCTGNNMSDLHSQLSEHTLWDGLKKEDSDVIESLLTEPIWEITTDHKEAFTEEMISNFTNDVIGLPNIKQGHVLLNEFWQNQVGDFELDLNRFPSLEETIEVLSRRGFRVVFTIQPFISTESPNFAEAVERRLLVLERSTGRTVPALTSFKNFQSVGVLDITNNRTIPWLVEKLKALMGKYKFNAFYLELGTAYDMPHYYQCQKSLINPDQYKTLFINSIQNSVSLLGVSDAIERPRSPSFVSLPRFESSWEGLRRVIPTILTYGVIGYPFVIPGAVGGDFDSMETKLSELNGTVADLPDPELYIRWLQLAAFLPVVRYNRLPTSYGDKRVSDTAISLALLRQNKVKPVLKKYARVSLNLGLPIIRPLWMLDPNDSSCHTVADEFSIGEDIIVAPILYSRSREREVYLPAGVWKDGIDGSLRKGSRWIHDYRVEEGKVAYFEKMPDDTRF
ncbi:myogenesis-regulating glycosidase isoform X2 [Dendroctonus ponderosae]|uniref:Glycoside hydrolase family 31 N-terminal domain-containing protein n=1 Tax=Dendroctonus ponderosae TaxID=77166 RepID=A0AAR5PSJ7_DENPD|nr:myogenesis-regulating glycosidase isoform X2 [Dendroctonus ponderosae]